MAKQGLTEKEQLVLYGIVKFPNFSDRELASKIDVNASTIATIRNKLKNSNYYNIIRIPNLKSLNYESLVISYDRISYLAPTTSPFKIIENISNKITNYFYMVSITDAWLGVAFTRDMVETQLIQDAIAEIKYKSNLSIKTTYNEIFPLKLSQINNFFDYSYLLEQEFGIEIDTPRDEFGLKINDQPESEVNHSKYKNGFNNFTSIEKQVFVLLNQNPDLSDHAIAKNTSFSSSTVNTINKRLTKRGLIKKFIIPNLGKIGFELMASTHLKFIPTSTTSTRKKIADTIRKECPNIFMISNNTKEIIFTIHKNFSDYQKVNEEIVNLYRENNHLMEDPNTIIFPLKEMNFIRYHYYQPILKNVLGFRTQLGNKILTIMKEHFGPGGEKILLNQLNRMDLAMDSLSAEELPKISEELFNVTVPIIGKKRAQNLQKEIKKLK
jgi:DNA-binding MarR family transcriptional regulator